METTNKGLWALRQLRQEIQDDTGLAFPQAMQVQQDRRGLTPLAADI